ncbi:MAG: NAD-dependent epimerase/dehydratase family protein [Actinomycetota bacterium]|nr:NAD-dependent epimerase/dehydratase family protein [Actinomycetota bacterium]
MNETVLVTGGTGFVGGAILRRLVGEGRQVRALTRSAGSASRLRHLGASPVEGDVLDFQSLLRAMEGCRVAYHAAGLNALCPDDPSALFRVNVDGSRNAVRAAAAAGVLRVVYTSSAATLGERQGTVGWEESEHRGWFLSQYERSKYEAEQAVLGESSVEVVSVNPSSVQGPERTTGTAKLFLEVLNGRLPVVVDTRISMVDVEDCARGHLLAEEKGAPGRRYLLSGATLTTAEAISLLSRVTGTELGVHALPPALATAAAAMVERAAGLMGRRAPVCREMVRTLLHGHAYDGSRASRELGLRYTPVEETLQRMVAWYVEHGHLRRR